MDGISSNGLVTFVSKHWSGRVSDNQITKESSLLEMLLTMEITLWQTNIRFDISDILPDVVTLNISHFEGPRSQLNATETRETARIADIRIHMERDIKKVKNYHYTWWCNTLIYNSSN